MTEKNVAAAGLSRRSLLRGSLVAASASLTPRLAQAQKLETTKQIIGHLPGPLVQPAKDLIGNMSKSLFGDKVGPFVSGSILDFFGLGDKADNYEHYFIEIEQKLDRIQNSLDVIDARIEQLRNQVDALASDITALSEKITNESTQRMLDSFSEKATVISEYFGSYRTAIAALASQDKEERKAGARQLYDLFGSSNAQAISVALHDIHEAFLPSLTQRTGLLAFQSEVIVAEIDAYSADINNLRIEKYADVTIPGVLMLREIPNDRGVFAFGKIHSGAHRIAHEKLDGVVANTLRGFVSAQLQGMVLLSCAWLGTINAPRLKDHIDRSKRILAAFRKLPEDVAIRVDAAVAKNLKQYARPLEAPMATSKDTMWAIVDRTKPGFSGRGQRDYPLSNEYMMWARSKTNAWDAFAKSNKVTIPPADMLMLIERPWQYDNCRAVQVCWKPSSNPPKCNGCGGELDSVQAELLGGRNIARFDRTPPKNLAFVRTLA